MYRVHRLVRFEQFATMHEAISREKQLKRWHRQWKINLIESENPHTGSIWRRRLGFRPFCRAELVSGPIVKTHGAPLENGS
jgi:putative endonuclease